MILRVDDIHLSEYELDESIECIFVRFPMPLGKVAKHDEYDSKLGNYFYSYDLLGDGSLTYLEIVNYKEAVKNKFVDIPFDFMVEFDGRMLMLRELLLLFTDSIK